LTLQRWVWKHTTKLVDSLPYSHDEVRSLPNIPSNPEKRYLLAGKGELTPETPEPQPKGSMLEKRPGHRSK